MVGRVVGRGKTAYANRRPQAPSLWAAAAMPPRRWRPNDPIPRRWKGFGLRPVAPVRRDTPTEPEKSVIVECIRYRITDPARRGELERAYAAASQQLDLASQCLGYELSHGVEKPERYVLRIEWTSREEHEQGFRGGPYFQAFLAAVRPHIGDIEEMKHYEQTYVTSVKGGTERMCRSTSARSSPTAAGSRLPRSCPPAIGASSTASCPCMSGVIAPRCRGRRSGQPRVLTRLVRVGACPPRLHRGGAEARRAALTMCLRVPGGTDSRTGGRSGGSGRRARSPLPTSGYRSAWPLPSGVGTVDLGGVRVIPADAAGVGVYRPQGSQANATATRIPSSLCTAQFGHRTAALRGRRRGPRQRPAGLSPGAAQILQQWPRPRERPTFDRSLRQRINRIALAPSCRLSGPSVRYEKSPPQRIKNPPQASGRPPTRPSPRRRSTR